MVKFTFYDPDDDKPRKSRATSKRTDGGFTMDWLSELGWSENPFRMVAPLAGLEDARKEINLFFVKKKRFGVIRGDVGMGKTTLLSWLYDELQDYKEIDCHIVDAAKGSDADFVENIYRPFKGMFGSKLPASHVELAEAVQKKVKGQYVLLIDNADHLEEMGWGAVDALMHINCSVIVTADMKAKDFPAADELDISLSSPSKKQYEKIISDRIELVGGSGIHPFTSSVIAKMAKDTDNIGEFLALAEETAINIALKRATLDEDVSEEDLAMAEETKAERKKGIKSREDPSADVEDAKSRKSAKKREYDALIESLIED